MERHRNISINQVHAQDAHYRYTMPPLEVRHDGRSKQRRTLLPNAESVSSHLRRAPELLMAYIARPLGTIAGCDRSSGKPTWFVKGHQDLQQLQAKVLDFARELVVCPKCGDCGTRLQLTVVGKSSKRQERHVKIHCGACGALEPVEMEPKLSKLLPVTAPRKQPKLPRSSKGKHEKAVSEEEEEDEEDVEWYTDLSADAVEARRRTATGGQLSKLVATSDNPPEAEKEDAMQAAIADFTTAFHGTTKPKEIMKAVEVAAPIVRGLTAQQSLEVVCGLPENVAKYSSLVLKVMYELDLVDEPSIREWYETADRSVLAVRSAISFLEFLEQAEDI